MQKWLKIIYPYSIGETLPIRSMESPYDEILAVPAKTGKVKYRKSVKSKIIYTDNPKTIFS